MKFHEISFRWKLWNERKNEKRIRDVKSRHILLISSIRVNDSRRFTYLSKFYPFLSFRWKSENYEIKGTKLIYTIFLLILTSVRVFSLIDSSCMCPICFSHSRVNMYYGIAIGTYSVFFCLDNSFHLFLFHLLLLPPFDSSRLRLIVELKFLFFFFTIPYIYALYRPFVIMIKKFIGKNVIFSCRSDTLSNMDTY